jgi:hypothetical protein
MIRILAQHCAHGVADRPRSLNLKRVAPCHSSCTSPCTRFGNSQRVRNDNSQRVCPPTLMDPRTTQCRSARTTAGNIHRPTAPLLCAQPANRRTGLFSLRAHNLAQLPALQAGTSNSTGTRLGHHGRTHRNSAPRVSQLLRRFSVIEDLYSQPITAGLSAGCKGSLHANSTPIPLQNHANR